MTAAKTKPILSVYMPVYNAGQFVAEAIESILSQTYSNFEFIIVDDASTDNSWTIIKKLARTDKRIHAYRNAINLGVSLASNIAISYCKGKYLARMDADDISASDRLEKQLDYLQSHPKTIVVGGQCTIIDRDNRVMGVKSFPQTANQIHDMIFWAVPVQQGYIMINRSLLPKNFAWYSPNNFSAEEVDLYFRLYRYGYFANLNDNLYFYRQLPQSLSHLNPKRTFWLTLKSRAIALDNGFKPTFKALVLNLVQVIAVSLLPNSVITGLWFSVRGIRNLASLSNSIVTSAKV